MEIVFLLILPVALWSHAWHMLGFYSSARSLGIMSAAVALALLGLVLFGRDLIEPGNIGSEGPLSAFILAWVFYAVLLAAVGLWGFDERTLGFYSLFLGITSLIFVAYYMLGDATLLDEGTSSLDVASGEAVRISTLMGIDALILTVLGVLLFFYLGPPFQKMRVATGWVFLVGSIVSVAMGGLAVLGLPLDT